MPTLKVVVQRDEPTKRLALRDVIDAFAEAEQTETEQLQRIELENLECLRRTA
jgi:hypothetical protein